MAAARVELVWDEACPNVEAARTVIRDALAEVGADATWREWSLHDAAMPERLRGYGSPTILVDGVCVSGQPAGDCDARCRIYETVDGLSGVPEVATLVQRLRLTRPSGSPRAASPRR